MSGDQRNQQSKDAIFQRIRAVGGSAAADPALRETHRAQELAAIPREFRRKGASGGEDRIALFQAILKHYGATSYVTAGEAVVDTISRVLQERQKKRLVVPPEFPQQWIPQGVEVVRDTGGGLSNDVLDKIDGVLSGCTVAIASTGSIVLASGRDGRRAISLVPDYQMCIVRSDQLVEFMAEALERLKDLKSVPLTFFSGPSATVDIEMTRVQGVHGPRTLDVVIAT
ncbi:MAG: LUD domain-containing protein [Acidobacteriia bacterium]|nr:LUD domain-containing protein [Terriglobia bacterium]